MKIKKISALLLAMLMVFSCLGISASAGGAANYEITNPYANINWSEINQYKTALHTHTNQSDGDPTMFESLERHAEQGFDIVATTDHGTVNYTWEENSENSLIYNALALVGKSEGDLVPLGKSGKFSLATDCAVVQDEDNLKRLNPKCDYTMTEFTYDLTKEGDDDYIVLSNGQKIMRVPYGIEGNAVSANAHVNSWFDDYHDNSLTTYESCLRGLSKTNAICVINHPGEYSKARYELHSEDAYNTDSFAYWYLVNKWAKLIDKYDFCIGIDMNSKGDGRTRFDRVLWDELLERFSAKGENVYAICSSDAHQLNKINTGYIYALMQNQTSADLKKAMQNGEMIGASHCNGNPEEMGLIAEALKNFYGESDPLYIKVNQYYQEMIKSVAMIENGEKDADSSIGVEFDFNLDSEGRFVGDTEPMITGITAANDKITITTTDAKIVRWISNGKQFAATKADGGVSEINLNDYKDDIGDYVRAEVVGEGGMLYTQAFLLNASTKDKDTKVVDNGYFNFGFIDCLFAMIHNWKDILSR